MGAWTYTLIAETQTKGFTARLNSTSFKSNEVCGMETTHQIGLWTSNTLRPTGRLRYAEVTDFAPMPRMSFLPAGVPWVARLDHECKLKPSFNCHFDPDLFRQITGVEPDDTPQFLTACLSVDNAKLQQAMWLLLEEVQNPGFAHMIAVESLGHLLLVELGRYFKSLAQTTEQKTGCLSTWQMERLNAYVEEVEGRPLTVTDMADLCGISAPHLRRLFKATTGMTVSSYVENKRISRAKSLLTERRMPLKEIAFRLGFSSAASFSTAFRRGTGMVPIAYRQSTSF